MPLTGDMDLSLGGDVVYESSKFAQVHNLIETGARTYFNARIGVETDTWSVALWGKNLTDHDYLQSTLPTGFTDATSRSPPRTYGVRAEFTF